MKTRTLAGHRPKTLFTQTPMLLQQTKGKRKVYVTVYCMVTINCGGCSLLTPRPPHFGKGTGGKGRETYKMESLKCFTNSTNNEREIM